MTRDEHESTARRLADLIADSTRAPHDERAIAVALAALTHAVLALRTDRA
jgi:hypothetical protein